jgi:hypothetical protein
MADPQKNEAKKELGPEEKLAAAKAELAKLSAARELETVQEQIDNIRFGGTPGHRDRMKKRQALREATFKETGPDGKVTAVYQIPHKGYRKGQLHDADVIVKVPIEELPPMSWLAVEKKPASKATEFAAKS